MNIIQNNCRETKETKRAAATMVLHNSARSAQCVCVMNTACKAIIISIFFVNFKQGIYNFIPEANHVSRACIVATFLYSQFVLHVMLFRP